MSTTTTAAPGAVPAAPSRRLALPAGRRRGGRRRALGVSELLAGLLPGGDLARRRGRSGRRSTSSRRAPRTSSSACSGRTTSSPSSCSSSSSPCSSAPGSASLARRRFELAAVGFVAFGVVGFLAALGDPVASPSIVAVAGRRVGRRRAVDPRLAAADCAARASGSRAAGRPAGRGRSRRCPTGRAARSSFARPGVGVARGGRSASPAARCSTASGPRRSAPVPALPPASETVPPLAAGTDLSPTIAGLTPIVMPNDRFYRIDTSLLTPSVDTATWTLRIHGLVDRETTLTWDELIGLPMFEQYVTIACVSNEVGGKLVGNAKWTGVRLRDVLEMAGVQAGATQLVGRSVDGWTAGMPTAWVMDPAREPMIAREDERRAAAADPRLPGPPDRPRAVRLRLGDEVAQGARADHARGVRRLLGPARLGQGGADPDPVADRHAARRPGRAGQVPIAGIAWAPDRGISKVEVGVDGVWRDARLSTPISDCDLGPVGRRLGGDARPPRRPGPGDRRHRRRSRPRQPSPPAPDGARGWHTVAFDVA